MVQVSNRLEDYEVLSILGADLNSTYYKVKNKTTSEIFVWKAVCYENFIESERKSLLLQAEKMKLSNHSHFLQVFDYILHEPTNILYLVSEFCGNGSLNDIVQRCLIENTYLSEEFLWRTLYQIACALKIGDSLTCNLSLNNIFIDADYNVKLFDNIFNLKKPENISQFSCFGLIIFELCTLQSQVFAKKNCVSVIKQILTEIPNYYSSELKEIIRFLMITELDNKATVDAVLCHPTILLKSTQVKIKNVYIKNTVLRNKQQNEQTVLENLSNAKMQSTFQLRLENIKNRETAVKIREEKLAEKTHELHKREKKVLLAERTVKEKILQAELYLKRCRETKSNNGSLKNGHKTISYKNVDSSFSADCGDSSIIISTTNKINPQAVNKPPSFIRMMSERRVRFKGHSPLKDMCTKHSFRDSRVLQQQSFNSAYSRETSSATGSENSLEGNLIKPGNNLAEKQGNVALKKCKSRKKLDLFSVLPVKSRKPLVDLTMQNNIIYEEMENKDPNVQYDYKPLTWTEECKQQAFDLLRVMNQGESNEIIKHTYL